MKKNPVELLREFSLPLILGVTVALIWANIDNQSYQAFIHHPALPEGFPKLDFHFLMNDIFMVLFFGIATVEIVQACLPGGSLNPWQRAVSPLVATAGGVLGPIAVFYLLCWFEGNPDYYRGFGIPTATDIAMAWLFARFIFGARHAAISFLLLLAIADDAVGLVIIAIFYPSPEHPPAPLWLLLVALGMALAYGFRKKNWLNFWPYLLGPGILSWFGLLKAGLHPALALVAIVPFMPAGRKTHPHLFQLEADDHSTISEFEHQFKAFVDIGLFGFGLANAGVPFGDINVLTWNILIALCLGKAFGVVGFAVLAKQLGFPLPEGMGKRDIFVVGLVAGVGLTVALFVAGVAFKEPSLQAAAKMGALFSVGSGFLAFAVARAMGIRPKQN